MMPSIIWNLTQQDVTEAEAKFLVEESIIYDTYHPDQEEDAGYGEGERYCLVDDVEWGMVDQFLADYKEAHPDPLVEVTLDDLRRRLKDRPMWAHALTVLHVIEIYMMDNPEYTTIVQTWLTDPEKSTVWLRDKVMEPLREDPLLIAIGKQFNPTTEWDNTWMPLDTAIYCLRMGRKIGE